MTDLLVNLLRGLPATLGLSFGAFAIGSILAIPLVLMRLSLNPFVRVPARIYVDVVRGIPPVVWLFVIFFGLGNGFVMLTSFQAALIGLSIISAGYLAEIYRGGFLSLHAGQQAAATALGMNKRDTLRFILGPQVLTGALPGMATFLVSLIKDSTVASTIGVRDIMMFVSQEAQSAGGGFLPFLFAGALYILLSIPVAWFARVADERLRRRISR